jgi:hypothetical protein
MCETWIENRRLVQEYGYPLPEDRKYVQLPRFRFKLDNLTKSRRIEAVGDTDDLFILHMIYDDLDATTLYDRVEHGDLIKGEV